MQHAICTALHNWAVEACGNISHLAHGTYHAAYILTFHFRRLPENDLFAGAYTFF